MTGAERLVNEGMDRKAYDVAESLLSEDMPLDKVSKHTGLDLDTLIKLKNNKLGN